MTILTLYSDKGIRRWPTIVEGLSLVPVVDIKAGMSHSIAKTGNNHYCTCCADFLTSFWQLVRFWKQRGKVAVAQIFVIVSQFGQLGFSDQRQRLVPEVITAFNGMRVVNFDCGMRHTGVINGKRFLYLANIG